MSWMNRCEEDFDDVELNRSQLAKGQVRSGKPGKANLHTATNIYKMRYDLTLEEEAQAYVDSCPRGGSALSTRPQSGENIEVNPSQTISCLIAVENALTTWWEQILINGINYKVKYNSFLENKPLAPTKFTQMAWALTYKIGCAVKRCDFGTVVVCRYRPRGNIDKAQIYIVGQVCAACKSSCMDGLCPTPPN